MAWQKFRHSQASGAASTVALICTPPIIHNCSWLFLPCANLFVHAILISQMKPEEIEMRNGKKSQYSFNKADCEKKQMEKG